MGKGIVFDLLESTIIIACGISVVHNSKRLASFRFYSRFNGSDNSVVSLIIVSNAALTSYCSV